MAEEKSFTHSARDLVQEVKDAMLKRSEQRVLGAKYFLKNPLYSMSKYQLRCDVKSATLEISNGAVVNLGYYSSYGGDSGAYENLMTDTEKSVYGTVEYVCK